MKFKEIDGVKYCSAFETEVMTSVSDEVVTGIVLIYVSIVFWYFTGGFGVVQTLWPN